MFPSIFVHKEIAESLKHMKLKPVSAGFCRLEGNGGFICFGNSESLDLNSREEDSDLLTVCFT